MSGRPRAGGRGAGTDAAKRGAAPAWRRGAVAAWAAAVLGVALNAAEAPAAAEEPVVELPPMIVAETGKTPPWYYTSVPGGECLSRCSPATTREFLRAKERQFQLLRLIVPDTFWGQSDVGDLVVLDRMELRGNRDEVAGDMMKQEGSGRVHFLPNLRVDDRDMSALFAYLDDRNYDGSRMMLLPDYVRALLERRTPMLPAWFIEGVIAVHRQASFIIDPITVRLMPWVSVEENRALQRDPDTPRALLPMADLFAPDALRGESLTSRRAVTWRAQVALFVRWGLDERNGPMRERFWKFAARAAEETVTEAMFEQCFGFGFSDMRDRLSDYLPLAVREPLKIEVGSMPRPLAIEPKLATPAQVARLRGEWERAEIFYVKVRHPQYIVQYADQARRTLRKGFDEGDRDPRLLASLGLCEIDAGHDANAGYFLERAVAAGVVRPRAYVELARLRVEALLKDQPADRRFTAAELHPALVLLRKANTQAPPQAESYGMMADLWLRASEAPPAADLEALQRAANLFVWRPGLNYRVALTLVLYGRRAEAARVVARTLENSHEEAIRERFAKLQAALEKSPAR